MGGLDDIWKEIGNQIRLLAFSGIAGAYFRAVLVPETSWGKRIAQGVGGAFSAICLGGILAVMVNNVIDGGFYSYLAAGFIMGAGGEAAVKKIQDRVLGGSK